MSRLIVVIIALFVFGSHLSLALAFGADKKRDKLDTRLPETDLIWIVKADGARSCEPNSGVSLDAGAEELKNAQVVIYGSKKGSDKKMHIQMCGASSGSNNAYLIPRDQLAKAMVAGYKEAKAP